VCKDHTNKTIANNMQQVQGTLIIQTNFIHISILNYIFIILDISFFMAA